MRCWLLVPFVACCAPRTVAAPAPLDCRSDGDCLPGPLVDPKNPCCDTGVHLSVFGKGYLEWRRGHLKARCRGVRCAALPSPALPQACALQGRCVKGQCRNRCQNTGAWGHPHGSPTKGRPTPPSRDVEPPMPGSFSALIPRPLSPKPQWVSITASRNPQGRWVLVGCETHRPQGGCRATRQVVLSSRYSRALTSLWLSAKAGNFLCHIRISMANWLPFEIRFSRGQFSDRMPHTEIRELPRCFPQAHLAYWLLHRWGGAPTPTDMASPPPRP